MKKLFAAPLALVMLLAMAGCSDPGEASLTGTWEAQVDASAVLDEILADMDEELQSYFEFDGFSFTMVMTLREDGTYTTSADEVSVEAAVDSLVTSLEDGMIKAMEAQLAQMGIDTSVEEALAATGMTMADLMTGIDAEAMVAQMTGSSEGNYKAEEGKLFLSSSLETTVDEAIYDTYELDGDTLTLTGHFGAEGEEEQAFADDMYPMVFQRID